LFETLFVQNAFCSKRFLFETLFVQNAFCSKRFLFETLFVRSAFCSKHFLFETLFVQNTFCSTITQALHYFNRKICHNLTLHLLVSQSNDVPFMPSRTESALGYDITSKTLAFTHFQSK